MARIMQRLATITAQKESGHGLVEFSVQFHSLPVDFGFDGRRLRGFSPGFYLTDVVGFERGKNRTGYKEFGPNDLAGYR